jgi:sugar (pentulose or hexulose) kinase
MAAASWLAPCWRASPSTCAPSGDPGATRAQSFAVSKDLEGLRKGVRLIGGGGKSALWRQILADIYGLPVEQVDLPANATALGAAIAGGVGVGLYSDYSVAQTLAPIARVDQPNPATQARYAALYALFQESYAALEPIFARLAALPG